MREKGENDQYEYSIRGNSFEVVWEGKEVEGLSVCLDSAVQRCFSGL